MNINIKSNNRITNTKSLNTGNSLKAVLDQHREDLRVFREEDEEKEKRKAE